MNRIVNLPVIYLSAVVILLSACAVQPSIETDPNNIEAVSPPAAEAIVTLSVRDNPDSESEAKRSIIELSVDSDVHEIATTMESSAIDRAYYPDFEIPEEAFSAYQSAFFEGDADYFYAIKNEESVKVYRASISISGFLNQETEETNASYYKWEVVKTVKF